MQPTPVFLPGESSWTEEHRVAKSRTGLKRLKTHTYISYILDSVYTVCVCIYIYLHSIYTHCLHPSIQRYIVEYSSARRKKKILPLAKAWMDLEGLTLSERSQREKDKPYDFICTWNLKKLELIETKSRLEVVTGQVAGGRGEWEDTGEKSTNFWL